MAIARRGDNQDQTIPARFLDVVESGPTGHQPARGIEWRVQSCILRSFWRTIRAQQAQPRGQYPDAVYNDLQRAGTTSRIRAFGMNGNAPPVLIIRLPAIGSPARPRRDSTRLRISLFFHKIA